MKMLLQQSCLGISQLTSELDNMEQILSTDPKTFPTGRMIMTKIFVTCRTVPPMIPELMTIENIPSADPWTLHMENISYADPWTYNIEHTTCPHVIPGLFT
jgi:hypothetical protein